MKIKGVAAKVHDRKIVGWTFDEENQTDHLLVEAYVGKNLVGSTTADIFRQDLIDLNIHPTGACGYELELKYPLEVYGSTLDVFVRKAGKRIAISRQSVEFEHSINDKKKLFFLHIPKTGGTSFRVMLSSMYEDNETYPNNSLLALNRGLYPDLSEVKSFSTAYLQSKSFVLGHYTFALKSLLSREHETLVFLRDPIKRAVSNLLHISKHDKRVGDLSLDEIYEMRFFQMNNAQVRYLADSEISKNMHFGMKKLDESALRKAKDNLKEIEFIGITERFEESVDIFNKKFNVELGKVMKLNKGGVKKSLSKSLKQRIIKDNQLDVELYEYANKLFNEKL